MKSLTLEQSLSQMLSQPAPKAKLTLASVWPKIQPFLLMIAMLIPKISSYINALIAGVNSILENSSKAIPPNIAKLWVKIRPFVAMLPVLFGKKVGVYINAFIAAMDKLIEEEDI